MTTYLAFSQGFNYTLEGGQSSSGKCLIMGRFRSGGRCSAASGVRGNRGFSLLELVVVVILVAVMAGLALGRLLAVQADAERVSMETVVGTLRSALGMKVAQSIVRGDMRELAGLEGSNPMDQLAEMPNNYRGVLEQVDAAPLEDGSWYFDKTSRELLYVVRNKAHFSAVGTNLPRARFVVRLVYADRDGNGRYDHGVDRLEGLRLAPVEPYKWMR